MQAIYLFSFYYEEIEPEILFVMQRKMVFYFFEDSCLG